MHFPSRVVSARSANILPCCVQRHTNTHAHSRAGTRMHAQERNHAHESVKASLSQSSPPRARTSIRARCMAERRPAAATLHGRTGKARACTTLAHKMCAPALAAASAPRVRVPVLWSNTAHASTRSASPHVRACTAPRRPRLSLSRLFCPLPSSFSSPTSGRRSRNWAALPCVCVCLSCLCVCPPLAKNRIKI